jgi:hypothetical protein
MLQKLEQAPKWEQRGRKNNIIRADILNIATILFGTWYICILWTDFKNKRYNKLGSKLCGKEILKVLIST